MKNSHCGPSVSDQNAPEEVDLLRGCELLRKSKRQFHVMDLEWMNIAVLHEDALRVSGDYLAEHLRIFADNVESHANATEAARKLGRWLTAISSKPEKLKSDWSSLAALAFWTARNAVHSWDYLFDDRPLRSHRIEWWERPNEPERPGSDTLGLKLQPTVNLHIKDNLIVAPRWFLGARLLSPSDSFESEPTSAMLKLAREVLSDYFRKLLASEAKSKEERTVFVHQSVTVELGRFERSRGERLLFGSYGGKSGIKPGDAVDSLMDCVRKKLETLDEWVFFPWKTTLLGLVPDVGPAA